MERHRSGNYDIYAQRVNASGAVEWTANGVALCTATGDQGSSRSPPMALAAPLSRGRLRSGNSDIYAQRVDASGAIQWTADGVALCSATGGQGLPTITSDGAGGAIVTWNDYRYGYSDIYAQRVNTSGACSVDGEWRRLLHGSGESEFDPHITSDGADGAIVTWQNFRSGSVLTSMPRG